MRAMGHEIFYWVFNMSITAAVTGVLVMLVRQIKAIPRRLTVLLWLIPFLRMALPFGLGSSYSLMALLSRIATKTVVVYRPAEGVTVSMVNMVQAANSYFPVTYKVNILEKLFGLGSLIWSIVFLALLLMLAAIYGATLREVKDAAHLRDNIYLSDKVTTPAVYGILKPRIVLPAAYQGRDIDLILLHEATHIRWGDNLWRMLAFLITAAHWFNPLAWVFLKLLLADLELACDERVLGTLGEDQARDYALSLLDSRESDNVFASAFGGAKIRTRIENILSFRKMTRLSLAVFLALIAAIFYLLLTNAG